jgi:hypothetical protein
MPARSASVPARGALVVSLLVAWINFLATTKWEALPGALNGPKRPWYFAALAAATILTLATRPKPEPFEIPGLRLLTAGAWVLLGVVFLAAFPPSTWWLIPIHDDWAPRFQSTVDGLRLLERGAVVGWNWGLLGGYQTSADLTQNLTMVAALPMWLLGDRLGFHLLHLGLVVAIPVMVYLDARAEAPEAVARLTAFFALICAIGLFGTIFPSGDTNAIAGLFSMMLTLTGSRVCRMGRRWGAALMVLGLVLAVHSHAAFFMYTGIFLCVEALFYRDWRMGVRVVLAGLTAALVALPQNVELVLYRDYFITNNIIYAKGPIDWPGVARKIFYNTELLVHPHRWFNDYLSLTLVFLAVLVWLALQPGRSRGRLYAIFAVLTIALLRLDVPEAGYLMTRQMHVMVAVAPLPLAWFVMQHSGDRRLAMALVAVIGLYVQTGFFGVQHVDRIEAFDAPLVERVRSLDGAMVLLENSPHRDLDADPNRRTERTPFSSHFEMLLTGATGKRLYGQGWDCWHWTPFRGQVVAGGSFRGRAIGSTPVDDFVLELRRWGVRHLLVWSTSTRGYLDAAPQAFALREEFGLWRRYELIESDPRSVGVPTGSGVLEPVDPLAGRVHLSAVRQGDPVVVRMNYFPAWTATTGGRSVELFAKDGQLAFNAPADGDYVVDLAYPRRRGLIAIACMVFVLGILLAARTCATRSSPSAAA